MFSSLFALRCVTPVPIFCPLYPPPHPHPLSLRLCRATLPPALDFLITFESTFVSALSYLVIHLCRCYTLIHLKIRRQGRAAGSCSFDTGIWPILIILMRHAGMQGWRQRRMLPRGHEVARCLAAKHATLQQAYKTASKSIKIGQKYKKINVRGISKKCPPPFMSTIQCASNEDPTLLLQTRYF